MNDSDDIKKEEKLELYKGDNVRSDMYVPNSNEKKGIEQRYSE